MDGDRHERSTMLRSETQLTVIVLVINLPNKNDETEAIIALGTKK